MAHHATNETHLSVLNQSICQYSMDVIGLPTETFWVHVFTYDIPRKSPMRGSSRQCISNYDFIPKQGSTGVDGNYCPSSPKTLVGVSRPMSTELTIRL
jgi:hypothetical protein